MVCCMTIMVDHCPAEKLLEHFLEFTEKINLNLKLMLHIGVDGRSVNLKFEDLLKSSPHIKSLGITILSIGTYPLHIVHNAFRTGVNALNFNINSFIIDVNFFFKLSAARRADYKQMQEFTDVIAHFIQKHSSTRWVTLRKICVKVLEQYQNLREYFLKFLPKTSTFKSTVRDTERCKRIKEVLENETSVPYIAFIAFIENDFEIFLKIFQSMKSRIHIVYPEMSTLLTSLKSKFTKSKLLRDDSNNAKSVSNLLTLNVKDTKNCKPLLEINRNWNKSEVFISRILRHNQYREEIPAQLFGGLSIFCFSLEIEITMAVINLKKSIFLNPAKKGDKSSLNAITNLTKEVCKPSEGVLRKIFSTCSTTDEVCDQIRNECRMYQIHFLAETSYNNEADETTQGRRQISYWENAFELAGLPFNNDSKCKVDIDTLIVSLEKKIADDAGSPKFPSIASLFKIVSSSSHGNSGPENGFSINKYLIQVPLLCYFTVQSHLLCVWEK